MVPTISFNPKFKTFGFFTNYFKVVITLYFTVFYFEMDVNQHFIKVLPPASLHSSPRGNQDSPRFLRQQQGTQLIQLNIGNYVLKAERVSNQSIDGYVAVFNQKNQLLFEGEFARSKKNGFGLQYNEEGALTFEGMFRDDKYDGWGRSDCYTGEYRDGLYDGYGVFSTGKLYY